MYLAGGFENFIQFTRTLGNETYSNARYFIIIFTYLASYANNNKQLIITSITKESAHSIT